MFEASGARFAAVRQLTRDARGQVHTKAARLDRLDGAVLPDVELDKLLEASVEQVAEGPDGVTVQVTELLGIGYEHFTQCVLLPQGRFAEFLHAKPGDRQDLLIKLLAYTVYEQVGQRARERGRLAASRLTVAEQRLVELGEITQEMNEAVGRRVADLADLTLLVEGDVADIAELRSDLAQAVERVGEVRRHLTHLAALRMPDEVPALAARLSAADELVGRRTIECDRLDSIEATAEQLCAGLTERSILLGWRDGYTRKAELSVELQVRFRRRDEAAAKEQEFAAAAVDAEDAVTAAGEALTSAEQAHRAAALATDLQPGQPCPVCLRPIGVVPHHDVPADLDNARATVKRAKAAQARLLAQLTAASQDAAVARSAVTEIERQLTEIPTEAPSLAEVQAALAQRDTADAEFKQARSAARTMRDQVAAAVRNRTSLQASEQQAWAMLRASRDGFVTLQAPAVDGADLSAAWQVLLDWAASQRSTLDAQTVELEKAGRRYGHGSRTGLRR